MRETVQDNTILIVDDEEVLLYLLKDWFTESGYTCKTVVNGEDALELLKESSFGIMLSDIVLPGIKGLELTEKAKAMKPDMDIILMTGYGSEFSFDQAIEAGASDFIKKPFTFQEVMARVKIVTMRKEIHLWAITDELTGLYNRKGFYALANHILKLAKRSQKGLFLLYTDMDNLKEINDKYGHHEGDQALIAIGRLLKNNFRESDIIARIGGDEFIVLPVGSTGDSTTIITQRLETVLNEYNKKEVHEFKISLSHGASFYDPDNDCSLDELISEADQAMYKMKRQRK